MAVSGRSGLVQAVMGERHPTVEATLARIDRSAQWLHSHRAIALATAVSIVAAVGIGTYLACRD